MTHTHPKTALASEVTIAEPSRLMKLLNDSIKWQRQQRLLSTDTPIDLFQNPEQTQEIEADAFVNQSYATIKVRRERKRDVFFFYRPLFISFLEKIHMLNAQPFLPMVNILLQDQ